MPAEPLPPVESVSREHRALVAHYGQVQRRCEELLAQQRAQIAALEAQVVRLRGAVIVRDTALAAARQRSPALLTPGVSLDVQHKSVLCIGRARAAGATQRLVEQAGGRYLHQDGRRMHGGGAFEASLRAADLVICQTGCLSHDAYWRVQDHCRRTGKPCVLLGQATQPLHFVPRGELRSSTAPAGH